jgi:hypothetical protein
MKKIFIAILGLILLTSCTALRTYPSAGETWRAKCYEKTHPMDFKITHVGMGFTTYRDSTSIFKIPTFTFQKEFVRVKKVGSDKILQRFHCKCKIHISAPSPNNYIF